MQFEFGPWRPDQPAVKNPTLVADNVAPSAGGFRPWPNAADFSSNGLDARCQGTDAFLENDGTVHIFAGDAAKLYRLTAGSTAFADVTNSGGGYSTGTDEIWDFAAYGNRAMATNGTNNVQSFVMGTSTLFADLGGSPPTAKYIAVSKNFVFLLNTATGPDYIQWSAQGDPTDWPTPGSADAIAKLSDRRQLAGNGGDIVGVATGLVGADIVIFQERQLVRGVFVGGDQVWQFDVAEGARGCSTPGSISQSGGVAYYLGAEGFYSYNGLSATPIGAGKVDKFFSTDASCSLDTTNRARVSSLADVDYSKLIVWAYPSVSGPGDGLCDKLLVYSWETGEWGIIKDAPNIQVLGYTRAPGYTLEDLDAFGNMDTLPHSLDSRRWTGGEQFIGAFDSTNTLQAYNGNNLAATLTSTERQMGNGYRMQVNAARPMVEGSSADITITPITRDRINDTPTTGTAKTMNARGICKIRSTGRFHRLQMDIAAAGVWEQAVGIEVPDEEIHQRGYR